MAEFLDTEATADHEADERPSEDERDDDRDLPGGYLEDGGFVVNDDASLGTAESDALDAADRKADDMRRSSRKSSAAAKRRIDKAPRPKDKVLQEEDNESDFHDSRQSGSDDDDDSSGSDGSGSSRSRSRSRSRHR